MVVGFLNQKGGVGKTTLAINVAGVLALKGVRVLVIDADHQGSALDWLSIRVEAPLFSVVGLPSATIHKQIDAFKQDYGHIVIDAPGRVESVARSIILASDIIVVPVQPSPYDVWAAKDVLDLIEEARMFNEDLKVAFVVNRKIVNTAIGRDVTDALAEYGTPVLSSSISQRVVFAESAAIGKIVHEVDSESPASREIGFLADELIGICYGLECVETCQELQN